MVQWYRGREDVAYMVQWYRGREDVAYMVQWYRGREDVAYMVQCGGRDCHEWFVEGHDRRSSSESADSNTGGDPW